MLKEKHTYFMPAPEEKNKKQSTNRNIEKMSILPMPWISNPVGS